MQKNNPLQNAIHTATKYALGNYVDMIKALLPGLFLLLLTIFLEYSISKSNSAAWIHETKGGIIFLSFLYFVRVFSYAFVMLSVSWQAGSGLFGEQLITAEIYGRALRSSFGAVFTLLPLWFLSVIFCNIMLGIFSIIYFSFCESNFLLVACFCFSLSLFFILIFTLIIAKFINIIPILTFESKPAIIALVESTKHLQYRHFLKAGMKPLLIVSLFVVAVVVPSWSFYLPAWKLFSTTQNFIIQSCAIVFSMFLLPVAITYLTAIYFGWELYEQDA